MERWSAVSDNNKGLFPVAYRLEHSSSMTKRIGGAPNLSFEEIINGLKGSKDRRDKYDFVSVTLENLAWPIWNNYKRSFKKKGNAEKESVNGCRIGSGVVSGNKVAELRRTKEWQVDEVDDVLYNDGSSFFLDTLLSEEEAILNKKVRWELTSELKKHFKPLTISKKNKKNIGLCSTSLIFFTEYVGALTQTKILQVCCNNLVRIPDEIGLAKRMRIFSASNNLIRVLPETIGYLEELIELKLSENSLTYLPRTIGFLRRLKSLDVSKNKLESLPQEIVYLSSLRELNLSDNLLKSIPAEIKRLENLENLNVDNCPLYTPTTSPKPRNPKYITLKELAARAIIKNDVPLRLQNGKKLISPVLMEYIGNANYCVFCSGPFFSAESIRYSYIRKDALQIPLEYRMCLPHWNTEEERLIALFRLDPPTALLGSGDRPPKSLKMPSLPVIDSLQTKKKVAGGIGSLRKGFFRSFGS